MLSYNMFFFHLQRGSYPGGLDPHPPRLRRVPIQRGHALSVHVPDDATRGPGHRL